MKLFGVAINHSCFEFADIEERSDFMATLGRAVQTVISSGGYEGRPLIYEPDEHRICLYVRETDEVTLMQALGGESDARIS